MRTFVDNAGRTWTVAVNVAAFKQLKARLGIDVLNELASGDFLQRLSYDAVLLADVLYVLCKDQADKQSVTDEQFGAALAGDVIEKATDALMEELVDFFPTRKRQLLRGAVQKLHEVNELLLTKAEARLGSLNMDEVEAELERVTSGPPSTKSPE